MSWDPEGIDTSESFREYVDELRETWPEDRELARKHGVPAGNGRSETDTMSSRTDDTAQLHDTIDSGFEPEMNRRAFMAATAAATATVVGAGTAAAEHSTLNYDSGLIPDPWISGTATVAEHDGAEMDSVTQYIDDADEIADHADYGGVLAPREDDTTPHNPVTLRADRIRADEYEAFPRGETYDDDNDTSTDEVDLNVLDATHWTTDVSGSAGSVTFEDVDAPSDGPALHMAASGQTTGDVVTARFDDFSIDSGELRKYLQVGITADAVPSGSVTTIRVEDSTGATVDTVIDPSADSTADNVIATGTTTGLVYQVQLGDLVSSLDTITALEIRMADENPDVTIFGLNLEKSSRWEFGTREFTNADDELDTETIYEPAGAFSITNVDTLGDAFSSAPIVNLDVDMRWETSGISDDTMVEYEFVDLDHPSYSRQFNCVVNHELPTAYDLEYSGLVFEDESVVWPEQYQKIEVATGESEASGLDDVENLDTVDRTDAPGDRGNEYQLSSTVSEGTVQTGYFEVRVEPSDEEEMVVSGASGPGGSRNSGGFFSSTRGMLAGAAAGVVAFIAMIRSRVSG